MNKYKITVGIACLAMLWWGAVARAAPVYIPSSGLVPDWFQPNDPVGGNQPGYPNWCAPTAVANAFGWWEDVQGTTGLTDRLLYPVTTAAPPAGSPLAPGLWKERLWQDGTVELGWYMNTGGWTTNVPQLPGASGTQLLAIGPGGVTYAQTAWVDGLMTKVAFPNASVATYRLTGIAQGQTASQTWSDYKDAIDDGFPVVVSWDRWVAPGTGMLVPGETDIYTYAWGQQLSEGHTVTGIGYLDPTAQLGDEMFIVHDNWSVTQKKVAMPLFTFYGGELNYTTNWWQNDHFFVPEPVSLGWLLMVSMTILARRRASHAPII